MKLEPDMSDDQILRQVGERLAQIRLTKNLTQDQLAEEAGLGLRTIQRLESGATATRLSGFVRVCRVLDLLKRFDVMIPEDVPSPIDQWKLRGKKRRRASGGKAKKTSKPNAAKKWEWGETS